MFGVLAIETLLERRLEHLAIRHAETHHVRRTQQRDADRARRLHERVIAIAHAPTIRFEAPVAVREAEARNQLLEMNAPTAASAARSESLAGMERLLECAPLILRRGFRSSRAPAARFVVFSEHLHHPAEVDQLRGSGSCGPARAAAMRREKHHEQGAAQPGVAPNRTGETEKPRRGRRGSDRPGRISKRSVANMTPTRAAAPQAKRLQIRHAPDRHHCVSVGGSRATTARRSREGARGRSASAESSRAL